MQVLDHLDLFDGDQPAALRRLEQFVQLRQEPVDLLLVVVDLDDHGHVAGQVQDLGRADPARGTVAEDAPPRRRARQPGRPRLLDDHLVQRRVVHLVRFAEENPQQFGFALEFHESPTFSAAF